ncbi:hypothetical protein GCM10029978_065360 [Actinoallomurus acanthiterrae]
MDLPGDLRGNAHPLADNAVLFRSRMTEAGFEVLPSDGVRTILVVALADEPWIGPYPGNPCHEVVVLACEYAGFQPRLDHFSDDFWAVVALIAAGVEAPSLPVRHYAT